MTYIVINQSSGSVLAMRPGRGLVSCKAYWTRERADVKTFSSGRYAAQIAKHVGGAVLTTREASLAGLIGKAVR